MNRRQFLKSAAATSFTVSLCTGVPKLSYSQDSYAPIDYGLNLKYWHNIRHVHWHEAITFARLRNQNPATGNERNAQFFPEVTNLINRSFSNQNIEIVREGIAAKRSMVRDGMVSRLNENREVLDVWFERLRISTQEQSLLLQSQSAFVVLAFIGLYDSVSAGDKKTWSWPYCST